MYQLIFLLPIAFIIGYIMLRNEKYSERVISIYTNISIPVILIMFLFYFDGSRLMMNAFFSILVSMVWIFRELLSNLGSTLYLYAVPQGWKKGDRFSLTVTDNNPSELIFDEVGFLRTPFRISGSNQIIHVPNTVLLSGNIKYLPKS